MGTRLFLQQLGRNRKRVFLNELLLIASTAFFVMSVNLYQNSVQNLEQVEETYTTTAIMEFYGNINKYGDIVETTAEDYLGYWAVGASDYDLSQIVDVDCVVDYDLRSRYGAYIPNEVEMANKTELKKGNDVIRFKLLSDEPVIVNGNYQEPQKIEIQVLDNAVEFFEYGTSFYAVSTGLPYDAAENEETIRYLNGQDLTDQLILYPGTEYIMLMQEYEGWLEDEATGIFYNDSPYFQISGTKNLSKDDEVQVYYTDGRNYHDVPPGVTLDYPFSLQYWEDVKNDPELLKYFESAAAIAAYNNCSYSVILTDDIMGVPAFLRGGAQLKEGRLITEEEYKEGTKVCVISAERAEAQGWKIGDKLEMHFFPDPDASYSTVSYERGQSPTYYRDTPAFCDRGGYEIVGIYDYEEMTGSSDIAQSTFDLTWTTIFVPKRSVANTVPESELPVHGSLLTLWLENGSIETFLKEMEARGVTQPREGEYQVNFVFDDQGYSLIQPGLQSMYSTARLLLTLSAILLVTTAVLLAFFFAQNQKHSVGILRMLGGSKARAILSALLCAALIAAVGCGGGTVLGHVLTQMVGGDILSESLAANARDNDFNAFLLDTSGTHQTELFAGADKGVSLLAGMTGLGAFLLLILVFVLAYIQKEPRTLLPQSKV